MAVQNALDCSCYLCMVHFSTTETKHNMNTHTASKPKSLLTTLALYMAQLYQNRCKSRGHANKAWEQVSDESKAVAVESMTDTIPEALARLTGSADFPTKQSLRSYLSITSDRPSATSTLHGFDDLYNELLAIFTLKHVVTVQQLEDRLAEYSEAYRLQHERHKVELAKMKHDSGAAANSYKSEADDLRRRVGQLKTESEYRNQHIHELTEKNRLLQAKNEELVGLPKPHHWDDIETMGDNSTIEHIPAEMVKPQPFHDGRPIVLVMRDNAQDVIIAKLQEDLSKANEYNRRANADCKTYAENAEKWQRDAQRLNGRVAVSATNNSKLSATIDRLKRGDTDLRNRFQRQSDKQNAEIERLNSMASTLLESSHANMSNKVQAVLEEFEVNSPTNDILDMVRAACERAVASDGLLDLKNKEIVALQSALASATSQLTDKVAELRELKTKRFGSHVEKVLEFRRDHWSLDEPTTSQIVHHILTASDLAEHTRTARSMEERANVVGHTPVPERQYEGGVPHLGPLS